MLYTIITILIIIACILLTLVVLVQNSKGGGLAANFQTGNQAFGVRQTADFLEKATWILSISILVFCLAATAALSTGNNSASNMQERLKNVESTPGLPNFPGAPQPEQPQAPGTQTPDVQVPATQAPSTQTPAN